MVHRDGVNIEVDLGPIRAQGDRIAMTGRLSALQELSSDDLHRGDRAGTPLLLLLLLLRNWRCSS
jgi:hypothetical protein